MADTSPGTGLLRRVAALFGPYKRDVGVVASLILVTAGLGVAGPLLIRTVFDKALFPADGTGVHRSLLIQLVAVMCAIPMMAGALGLYQTYLTNVVGQKVMRDLRDKLYRHLQSLPLRFFTATRTGEIQSRLANDVGGLQSVVTDTASSVFNNVVVLVSTVIAMVLVSWQLTLLSLALVPVFVLLSLRVGKLRRQIATKTQVAMAEMSAITEETLSVSGVLLSKVFGRQAQETVRYNDENERLAALQVRQQIVGRSFFAVVQIFFSITPALTYLVAGLSGVASRPGQAGITYGTLVAFTTLQTRLFFPIGNMLETSTQVQSSFALFGRVFDYLDLDPEITDSEGAVALDPTTVQGDVVLDSVFFRYDGQSATDRRPWALEDLSLHVRPGQLAAVVGPSGAGKTTISYLVPRLYDVTQGRVLLDGRDVRELTLASLADTVGMVTQESYLFHATIRDNIAYAKPSASDAEIEAAAAAAYIHDRIMDFPEGYDTVVGERGYRLSGGEKQRLAIARVLLKDPKVLILDEATSALDTASERIVQAALQPLVHGRTTIAIAHRLSTIVAADVIFVVDRGRVVEQGSHLELLASGGVYAGLYDQQFGGGTVEARCADGMVLSTGQVLSAVD